MWGTGHTSSGASQSKEPHKGVPPHSRGQQQPGSNDFRVVERVAYAHPVRDHQVYYAPKGNNQYEQRQPPPIPPHPSNNHQVGYPFFGGGSNANEPGRARVRRGDHNSECVLYDPSESVVVSSIVKFLDEKPGFWTLSGDFGVKF